MSKITFVAGVHGVGKTTICTEICKKLEIIHLTASEIIKKYNAAPPPADGKLVKNITDNQVALVEGLKITVTPGVHYLLDGHLTLLNSRGAITRVPTITFQSINPDAFIVISDEPQKIFDRISSRDKVSIDLETIELMQREEAMYAQELGSTLNKPVHILNNNINDQLLNILQS